MGARLFALARAVVVGIAFVSIWMWFVPRWMAGGPLRPDWNVAGVIFLLLGAAVMIRCVWDFAWRGRGTPVPFDPPRRLVASGLYRWVRNPMYIGLGLGLIGEALVLPPIRREMLLLAGALWIVTTLFIIGYEEPTLRRQFGEDYERYCRNVRRWLPRLTPYV